MNRDQDNHLFYYITKFLVYNDWLFDNDIHLENKLLMDYVEYIVHQYHFDNQ